MGIKITDSSTVSATNAQDKNRQAKGKRDAAASFQDLLRNRIAGQEHPSQSASAVSSPHAPFPVYEIDDLPDSSQGINLREKGIVDTDRLIAIMDDYHQKLEQVETTPYDGKKLIEDMEKVSRDMLGYMSNLTSSDNLYKLMRDSVVMARVEIEKYVRGDYG
ncbi:MAG: hypothetical protein U9P37_04535 [Pseudomonadota bacterium]|nr:hypothetical protein [Pseudomonadota bacterium]